MVADCADKMGLHQEICFLDDSYPERTLLADWSIIDSAENYRQYITDENDFFVAIGNNVARQFWLEKLAGEGANIATLIHPKAVISQRANILPGSLLLAGAVVNILASIGKGCIINTGATVDHDCYIGDYSHLAPGTHFAGTIKTGVGVFFGVGSSVIPNLTIGHRVIVGAGSTVLSDLPDDVTAVGVPAQIIKQHEVSRG